MSNKTLRTVLICVVCILGALLVALAAMILIKGMPQAPSFSVPTTEATQSTTLETTEATTEETTEATTEPQPVRYVLTFAGDCTLANQRGASLNSGFIGLVGQNYDHPFADVIDYFKNDTATFINLECTFTESNNAANKRFTFKGPKDYINILTRGSVEFANVANNHSYDYGEEGFRDTVALLDEHGIAYAEHKKHTIFEVADGLKIGVYAVDAAHNTDGLAENIKALKKAGADIIVASMHWGQEYYYVPNQDQIIIARAAIDAGADIVYGHHPHVLQKIEEYKDGIIFYSLGNFSFGGNNNPADKDTAILQQEFIRYPDGTLEMGELTIIPCYVTGIVLEWGNDYQPMPIPETDADAYQRVLNKLAGKHPYTNLYVPYRDDIYGTTATTGGTDSTDSTDSTVDTGSTDTTEDGTTEGGTTEGGTTEGGTTEGGTTEGGTTEGGTTEGGSTEGGTTEGGTTEGGTTEGGTTEGGSTEGGSTEGGTTEGGATEGGTTEGGATEGGTAESGTSESDNAPAGDDNTSSGGEDA